MIRKIESRKRFRTSIYIPAEIRDHFDMAVDWDYTQKLIKKPAKWRFCKFAIVNTVNAIMEQIEKENKAKARAVALDAS